MTNYSYSIISTYLMIILAAYNLLTNHLLQSYYWPPICLAIILSIIYINVPLDRLRYYCRRKHIPFISIRLSIPLSVVSVYILSIQALLDFTSNIATTSTNPFYTPILIISIIFMGSTVGICKQVIDS